MTPKEYLLQIKRIDKLIDTKIKEIENLEKIKTGIQSIQAGLRVKKSRSLSAPFEDVVAKIDYLKRDVNNKIDLYVDLQRQAENAIESLTNNDERLILVYRYIEGRTWESISCELSVDEKTVRNWHASALKHMKMPKKPIRI